MSASRIADHDASHLRQMLTGTGLWLDIGATQIHLRSDSPHLASQLQRVYGRFPLLDRADWADLHLSIRQARGLRRWMAPQVCFQCDGQTPFEPFSADSPCR
ncbi:MAG: hypothetical protein IPO19_00445 [Rhodoferax sp.]|nr:hypothetical protein [Rhodoferax sp.]